MTILGQCFESLQFRHSPFVLWVSHPSSSMGFKWSTDLAMPHSLGGGGHFPNEGLFTKKQLNKKKKNWSQLSSSGRQKPTWTGDGTQQGLSIKVRQRFLSPAKGVSSRNSAREIKRVGAAWRQGKALPRVWWTVPTTAAAVTPPQPGWHGENTAGASPSSSLLPVPALCKAQRAPSTFSLLLPSPWPGSSSYALRLFWSGFPAQGCNLD